MRTRLGRTVLVGLSLLSLALLAAIVYPFAGAFLFAAVFAGSFNSWVERLTSRLWGRRELAAGVMTVAVALLIVLPVGLLVITLGREAVAVVTHVRETLRDGGIPALVADLPPSLQGLALVIVKYLPQGGEPIEDLGAAPTQAAAAMGGVVMATSRVLLEIGLMLVALYFLLVDGPHLVDWLADVAPIGRTRTLELLSDFRNVSEAVLFSSFATAGVQSVVALAGFLAVGVPQPLLFTLATFIVAFIPVLGAASVGLALAVALYVVGQLGPGAALALGLWSVLGVGLADNLVKPMLMKGRMEIHGAIIFFALVGGLAAFGLVGLAAGPLIVSFFLAIVRMCRRDLPAETRS